MLAFAHSVLTGIGFALGISLFGLLVDGVKQLRKK